MLTLNQIRDEAYETGRLAGFYGPEALCKYTVGDLLMLMVTELAEAMEDHRAGYGPNEIYHELSPRDVLDAGIAKPCGIPSELADVIIRIAGFAGIYGIDLDGIVAEKMAHNKTRGLMNGGKKL